MLERVFPGFAKKARGFLQVACDRAHPPCSSPSVQDCFEIDSFACWRAVAALAQQLQSSHDPFRRMPYRYAKIFKVPSSDSSSQQMCNGPECSASAWFQKMSNRFLKMGVALGRARNNFAMGGETWPFEALNCLRARATFIT